VCSVRVLAQHFRLCICRCFNDRSAFLSIAAPCLCCNFSKCHCRPVQTLADCGLGRRVQVNQKVVLRVLQKLQKGREFKVQVVDTGAAVLAAMRLHVFDIILMDIHMPEMDGLQVTLLTFCFVTVSPLSSRSPLPPSPSLMSLQHLSSGCNHQCAPAQACLDPS